DSSGSSCGNCSGGSSCGTSGGSSFGGMDCTSGGCTGGTSCGGAGRSGSSCGGGGQSGGFGSCSSFSLMFTYFKGSSAPRRGSAVRKRFAMLTRVPAKCLATTHAHRSRASPTRRHQNEDSGRPKRE